jgi:hypothetical protein
MLASITPLGERSRGFSWRVTAATFALGALTAGAAAGAVLGLLGSLLPAGHHWRVIAAAAATVAAIAFDATPVRLPTTRRQVNEDWLGRYRGWVYGIGFGAQLGVGVATIVTTAAVYLAGIFALLTGDPGTGAVVGVSFGAIRALSLLPACGARDPQGLSALHRRLLELEPRIRTATPVLEMAVLIVLLAVLA